MEKQDMWFSLSEKVYSVMKDYALKAGLPKVRSKFILYVFFNYTPSELLRDFSFTNETRKMVCAKVSKAEANKIEALAGRYDRTVSALARDMLYTFLKENGHL